MKSDCRNRQRDMKKATDSGKPVLDRKQTAPINDDEITDAVIEGIPNLASSSHDSVFVVTEKPRRGNHAVRWKTLLVLLSSPSCKRPCQRFNRAMFLGPSLTPDQQ